MMKKALLFVSLAALYGAVSAESLLKPVNDLGYGTWSARLQTLSMYRDFENNTPGNAYSTTAGLMLGYASPEFAGFSAGGSWIYVEPVDASEDSNNGKTLLSNGRANILNEAWLKYRFEAVGLTNTFVKAGRQVINSEVFRADEVRQKPRSVEAVQLTTKDIPLTTVTFGHAWRLSNVYDNEDSWKFKDIDEVLTPGCGYNSRGISWGEAVFTGITNLEVAAYEAYVYDIANIAGGRARYAVTDKTALLGYYRHENSVQTAEENKPLDTDMYGLALQQKIGDVITIEPGWFSVKGGNLLFSETTTGINHPVSTLIYSSRFNGGADTGYLKTVMKIRKTTLTTLYTYTVQDHGKTPYDVQEIDFFVKHPLTENLSVTVKVGAGYQDRTDGKANTTATDARLFVTYNF